MTYNNLTEKGLPGNFFYIGEFDKIVHIYKLVYTNMKYLHLDNRDLDIHNFTHCTAHRNYIDSIITDGSSSLSETLRALYLGDNDLEFLPGEVKNLKNLTIVSHLSELRNLLSVSVFVSSFF